MPWRYDTVADFDIDISANVPARDALFNLEISSDEGNWSDTFYLHIDGTIEENPCDNAIPIHGCGAGYIQTYETGSNGVWNTTSCGYYAGGSEQVYRFVAPASGTYSIEVTSAEGLVDYFWRTSDCREAGWHCVKNIGRAGIYGMMNWRFYLLYPAGCQGYLERTPFIQYLQSRCRCQGCRIFRRGNIHPSKSCARLHKHIDNGGFRK